MTKTPAVQAIVIVVIRTLANLSGFHRVYKNKRERYRQLKSQRVRDGRDGSSFYCRVNNTLKPIY